MLVIFSTLNSYIMLTWLVETKKKWHFYPEPSQMRLAVLPTNELSSYY